MERTDGMQADSSTDYVGRQVGHEAVGHGVQRAEDYCESERQRIEVTNQPKIIALKAKMSLLVERERDLKERIRRAPPPGDRHGRRRKSLYSWTVTIILAIAGFFFSLLAFDPYRLGWKSYLYCVGIAIVVPFCTDRFLEAWGSPRLIKALTAVAFATGLTSLVLLAVIRGNVLSQQIQTTATSAVVILDGANQVPAEPQNNFFDATLPLLTFFMALLALALELGAGLALHDARRLGTESGEDATRLAQELAAIQDQMVSHVLQIGALQNEAAMFVTQFWRDFYRAMLNGTVRSALTRFSVLLCMLFLGAGLASAGQQTNLVIAIDLSQSVGVRDSNQHTEFAKNLAGVRGVLASVPRDARVTVLGITDNSFGQPNIMLTAEVDGDEGYFKERLSAARRQIAKAWQDRSAQLSSRFPHTDVLGGLLVAAELFKQTPGAKNVLVIFSDMRHETRVLDLERPANLAVERLLAKTEQHKLLAELQGVEVYALGVDSAGKPVVYWASLREFWNAYFRRAGANLKAYSVLRDLPEGVLQ